MSHFGEVDLSVTSIRGDQKLIVTRFEPSDIERARNPNISKYGDAVKIEIFSDIGHQNFDEETRRQLGQVSSIKIDRRAFLTWVHSIVDGLL